MQKTILLFALSTTWSAYAATCNTYEYDKAAYFAEIQGREVVEKYQGGNNIRTDITRCEYNSYSNKYTVEIDVYWDGALSGKRYNSSGRMTMNSDGRRRDYDETYRNQNLKDYAFMRGMGTGFLWFTIVAEEHQQRQRALMAQSSRQSTGYNIWVKNACQRQVNLIIHYKDAYSNRWLTSGSYTFNKGEQAFLSHDNNNYLKTNNSVLYYAIKQGLNNWGLTTHTRISHNGNSYLAREVRDTSGDTEIYLCVS